MTIPNESILPGKSTGYRDAKYGIPILSVGLTKREFFAALALQRFSIEDFTKQEAAEAAVAQADLLIVELNKSESK